MIEIIVPVILAAVKWFFDMKSDNRELAKLIERWIQVMRVKFDESPAIKRALDDMNKEAKEQPWKETGGSEPQVVNPIKKP